LRVLSARDIVAADAVLVSAHALQLDESMLTGESLPVGRAADERVFAGTVVTRGRARATVVAVGAASELGGVASALHEPGSTATPLQRQLAVLGRAMAVVVAIIAVVLAVLNVAAGRSVETSAVLAVSLAVAAIPESLPAVVSLALAMAARRMAHLGVLTRRLAAVEALGSVTVLAVDKTGTLTEGRMTVAEVWVAPDVSEPAALLRAAALCNDAAAETMPGGHDDPTEVALVHAAADAGLDVAALRRQAPRIAEVPFDAALAQMDTVHRTRDGEVTIRKGAPEAVLAAVTDRAVADLATTRAAELAMAGRRVLAVAEHRDGGWRLLGLLALQDPPRAAAADFVTAFRRAGVRPVMITGDRPDTAARIAGAVGIADSAGQCEVYARITPSGKTRVVGELQSSGEIVAMTGDGVNDAPALRRADVGVAMGRRGTEVAKQAADLVLTDDDLTGMVAAIGEGRRVYDNLRRFLWYALAGGTAEVLIMLLGPLFGLAVPLQAGQILWVNLLTHGAPGVAMGAEPAERDVLHRAPRRPDARLVDRTLAGRVLTLAAVTTAVCLSAAAWVRHHDGPWQSTLFLTLVLAQLAVAAALRPLGARPMRDWALPAALLGNAALVWLALAWGPLRELLRTEHLASSDWAIAIAGAALVGTVSRLQRLTVRAARR
jgi:Ca2+-transporting ATPase